DKYYVRYSLFPTDYSLLFQRHHGGILGAAQGERRLHVAHVRLGREPRHEILERAEVRRHTLEDEIDFPGQHPAFPHQRFGADEVLERLEVAVGLAGEMHHGEDRDLVAEPLLVQERAVALDEPRLLERADAAEAWRRRDPDPARQF